MQGRGGTGEQCYLKLAYVVLSGALSRKASLKIFCQSHRSIRERYGISRRHRLARSSLAMNDVLRL